MGSLPFEDEVRILEHDVAVQTWEYTGADIASEDIVTAAKDLVNILTMLSSLLQFW
jgi:hypothetical protein